MQILLVPVWGFSYSEAEYYGWRHAFHLGPLLIFWDKIRVDLGEDNEQGLGGF